MIETYNCRCGGLQVHLSENKYYCNSCKSLFFKNDVAKLQQFKVIVVDKKDGQTKYFRKKSLSKDLCKKFYIDNGYIIKKVAKCQE